MIPFKTNPDKYVKIDEIAKLMQSDLTKEFINSIANLAKFDEGVCDLMEMWVNASVDEKEGIVDDLRKSLNDYIKEGY